MGLVMSSHNASSPEACSSEKEEPYELWNQIKEKEKKKKEREREKIIICGLKAGIRAEELWLLDDLCFLPFQNYLGQLKLSQFLSF